jgi:hypothetical protein
MIAPLASVGEIDQAKLKSFALNAAGGARRLQPRFLLYENAQHFSSGREDMHGN